jgi:hypothetical protein
VPACPLLTGCPWTLPPSTACRNHESDRVGGSRLVPSSPSPSSPASWPSWSWSSGRPPELPGAAVAVEAPVLAAAPVGHLQQSRLPTRQSWLWCVVAVTVGAFAVSIVAAPPADATPARGLSWLLFVGSSVHIAATGWLFSFRDVRSHARQHLARYVVAPVALIAAGGAIVGLLSLRHLDVMLLGYFGWQFLHYQKQNLGLAALAASSRCAASLTTTERKEIMATGWMGIAALMLHPGTLQLPLNPHLGWYPGVPFHLAASGSPAAPSPESSRCFGAHELIGPLACVSSTSRRCSFRYRSSSFPRRTQRSAG